MSEDSSRSSHISEQHLPFFKVVLSHSDRLELAEIDLQEMQILMF
jgi:hypothetical protein